MPKRIIIRSKSKLHDIIFKIIDMKDATKAIGGIIDKAGISIISSVDSEGFPNIKAMLPTRKRVGIKEIYFSTNTSSIAGKTIYRKP